MQQLTANLHVRVSEDVRPRVDSAARDCGLAASDWLRQIIALALELHDEQMRRLTGDLLPEDESTEAEPQHTERASTRTTSNLSPRDCSHHPAHRRGDRCTRCGLRLRIEAGGSDSRLRTGRRGGSVDRRYLRNW